MGSKVPPATGASDMTTTKIQLQGNCQCCGRLQAVHAVKKLLSQHGYEVKGGETGYGYFAGVCPGRQYQPMQMDRTITDSLIKSALEDAARLDILAADVKADRKFPNLAKSGKRVQSPEGRFMKDEMVAYAEAPAHYQQQAKEALIWSTESRARSARTWADQMEKLLNRVHGQPLDEVKVAEAAPKILAGEQRTSHRGVLTSQGQFGAMVSWKDAKGFKGRMSSRSWRTLPLA